jgi:hypothetical protein
MVPAVHWLRVRFATFVPLILPREHNALSSAPLLSVPQNARRIDQSAFDNLFL